MHYQRYKVQNSITKKKQEEAKKSSDNYYLKFITRYTKILLSKSSTEYSKITAAEMLGSFANDTYVKDTLNMALKYSSKGSLLHDTLKQAIDGEFLSNKEEDEYEKFVTETGLRAEIEAKVRQESEEFDREDRMKTFETNNLTKYRAILEKIVKN
jgi:hypothetical protein